jgi:signal transduction histidine kinase
VGIGLAVSRSIVEAHGEIVAMYAMVNRIRLFASGSVLEAADAFVKALVEKYGEKI